MRRVTRRAMLWSVIDCCGGARTTAAVEECELGAFMQRSPSTLSAARPPRNPGALALACAVVATLVALPTRAQDASGTASATRPDPADTGAPAASATSPAPVEPVVGHAGQILVSSGLIRGFRGNKLLVRATTLSGVVGARLCVDIPDDAFALPELPLREMPADQDWCGPETPIAEFPPGDAYVSARVVRPGAREPLASVVTTVTVNGDTHVALDGARLSFREHKHTARPLHP